MQSLSLKLQLALNGSKAWAKVMGKMLFSVKQVQSWMVAGWQPWQKLKETEKGTGATGQHPGGDAECCRNV